MHILTVANHSIIQNRADSLPEARWLHGTGSMQDAWNGPIRVGMNRIFRLKRHIPGRRSPRGLAASNIDPRAAELALCRKGGNFASGERRFWGMHIADSEGRKTTYWRTYLIGELPFAIVGFFDTRLAVSTRLSILNNPPK